MKKEKCTLKIKNLDHFGRGIGRIDEKIVFVPFALKDEIVDVIITTDKKNYMEAKLCNIKEKAKERTDVICPYFYLCGGCHLMHLSVNDEIEYKKKKVIDVIEKFTNLQADIVTDCVKTNNLYYRNKVIFHVENKKIGFFKEKSHTLVEIDHCYLINKRMNEVLSKVKKIINENDIIISSFMIRYSETSDELMLVINGKNLNNRIRNYFKDINVKVLVVNDNVLTKDKAIVEKILNKQFLISKDSFFQVNTKGCENLYSILIDEVKKQNYNKVLDLYCGTGTIGILISDYVDEVIGIEVINGAVLNARDNALINNVKNIKFLQGKVEDYNLLDYENPDLIIVDPPRSGLNKKTISEMIKLKPKAIFYVSCDVVTLARDLNLFTELYNVQKIIPVDMFHNTYHVECVCILKLKEERNKE